MVVHGWTYTNSRWNKNHSPSFCLTLSTWNDEKGVCLARARIWSRSSSNFIFNPGLRLIRCGSASKRQNRPRVTHMTRLILSRHTFKDDEWLHNGKKYGEITCISEGAVEGIVAAKRIKNVTLVGCVHMYGWLRNELLGYSIVLSRGSIWKYYVFRGGIGNMSWGVVT